jgi:hypothetical protein
VLVRVFAVADEIDEGLAAEMAARRSADLIDARGWRLLEVAPGSGLAELRGGLPHAR